MAPGETLPPLPLQGPGGFLNSPTADTKIPKTVKYFGLEGIASTRVAEPGAQSPFSASIDNQSITVGAADLNDGRRDPVEQEVTFLIKDKCADLMKDPSREVPITLRLVMDPSRRPLTEAEKAEQLRRPASGSSPALIAAAASNETTGTSGTSATSEAAPESTAPFNPHKERAEAAPAN